MPEKKLVSKTGAVGAALGIYGVVKLFYPNIDNYVPPGLVEAITGGLVMLFRKTSRGQRTRLF